ncbi:MAG: hypothetical protein GY851_09460 [bacterium]|nr:hypothetical protein [bacterium]
MKKGDTAIMAGLWNHCDASRPSKIYVTVPATICSWGKVRGTVRISDDMAKHEVTRPQANEGVSIFPADQLDNAIAAARKMCEENLRRVAAISRRHGRVDRADLADAAVAAEEWNTAEVIRTDAGHAWH